MPPVVAWCDPGGMTGIARLLVHEGYRFSAGEWPFHEAVHEIELLAGSCGPALAIGWERYKIIPGLPQDHAHEAIEMIGAIKSAALRHRCMILTPAAPSAREPASPAVLQRIGWWVPGKDDAQSAAQHLLAWLLRTGNLPPFVVEAVHSVGGSG